eukprot:m.322914 g.322914  ORF g.322914 m.322914 type:complete len:136 (+) comp27861_c0_seq1:61-468(+)
MLPLTLLRAAQNHPMLIELKNGETYNGQLVSCDSWMNINLKDVTLTSRDGDRFWKIPECYIRGNTIKYLRIPDEVMELAKEEDYKQRSASAAAKVAQLSTAGRGARGGRGGRGGEARGRGGRGGGRGGRGRGGST